MECSACIGECARCGRPFRSRQEAAAKLHELLEMNRGVPGKSLPPIPDRGFAAGYKDAIHFGRVELRHFLDWLYGGPPKNEEEEL